MTARLSATAAISTALVVSPTNARTAGRLRMTKANSEPWARRKPSCVDPGTDQRKTRLAAALVRIFTTRSRTATPITAGQKRMSAPRSRERPTEMKKKPSSSPRNGLISDWIIGRYGVSAMIMPPRKAPRVNDRPIAPVAHPAASATRSAIAVKTSSLRVRAIKPNSGRTTRRASSTATPKAPPPSGARRPWPAPRLRRCRARKPR